MLEIKVQDKSITTVQKAVFIRGTVGEKVAISCDDEWGDRLKTVVFKRLDPCAEPIVNYIGAVDKTEVVIPHEILHESGQFHIGLYSVMGAETTPTFWSEVFEIEYGTDTDGIAPQPPTPSEYSQLIQLAEETKEIANSVREDADIGAFNGEDGFSPMVDVEQIEGGHRVTITDKSGENTFDVMDGKDGQGGSGGGSTEGAVLYTEQTLGEEQKAQARKNIEAANADYFTVTVEQSANLFDKTQPRESGLLQANGAVFAQVTEHATIPVEPGKTYTFPIYYSWFGYNAAYAVNCYDANMNRLADKYGGSPKGTPNADNTLLTFTVPTNFSAPVSFVKVNVAAGPTQTALNVYIDKFMFVEGTEYPSEYIPYGLVEKVSLNPKVQINGNVSELNGKSIVFTGDSICAGTSDESGIRGWAQRIGEKYSMNWQNKGINGATITSGVSGSSACIADTDFGANPDYIILEGGTNDADLIGTAEDFTPEKFGSYTLGQYNVQFDKTTFCGAVESLFKRVTTDYAGAKIGFIIAHKMGYATTAVHYDAKTSRRRFYFETIIELCKKWGISYIDLWDGCYLCPMNPAHNTANTNLMYVGDYQHLAKRGYDYITPMIEKWIESL